MQIYDLFEAKFGSIDTCDFYNFEGCYSLGLFMLKDYEDLDYFKSIAKIFLFLWEISLEVVNGDLDLYRKYKSESLLSSKYRDRIIDFDLFKDHFNCLFSYLDKIHKLLEKI